MGFVLRLRLLSSEAAPRPARRWLPGSRAEAGAEAHVKRAGASVRRGKQDGQGKKPSQDVVPAGDQGAEEESRPSPAHPSCPQRSQLQAAWKGARRFRGGGGGSHVPEGCGRGAAAWVCLSVGVFSNPH